MPVKKPVRRTKSPRTSSLTFVERSMASAKSVQLASVKRLKKLANLTTGMDTAIVVTLVGTVVVMALIGALALSRRSAHLAADAASAAADSAIVHGSGVPPVEATHVARAAAQNQVAQPTPVTITGCLERDDEMFRLKDTAGADAPRSRSWKSAFLKKGSAPVEVVDASNRLRLTNHVGERVSVTGTLRDGEMQIRSLRRVAASCRNTSSKVTA
jgi:hypothetical protein